MNMHIKFLLTCTLIVLSISLKSQTMKRWLDMEIGNKENIGLFSSYVIEDEVLSGKILDQIDNLRFSRFDFCSLDSLVEGEVHNYLLGGRGTMDGEEILILDTNMDNKVSSNEIFTLPKLKLDKEEDYDSRYSYHTPFRKDIDLKYEYVYKNQIFSVPVSLKSSVSAKYDTLTNSLYYRDNFRIGIRNNLFIQNFMNDSTSRLVMNDYLPNERYILFTFENEGVIYEHTVKEKFSIGSSNGIYSIDSLDFINKRILVSTHKNAVSYIISGPSLTGNHIVSSDKIRSSYKILQFWGSWCGPCIENFPKLKLLSKEYDNIEIMGVNIDYDKKTPIEIVNNYDIEWENIFIQNEEDLEGKGINIWSFPTYLLLDNNNYLIGKFGNVDELRKLLEKL